MGYMKILALDAAVNHTGWCVGDEDGNICGSGLIIAGHKIALQDKIKTIYDSVQEIIEDEDIELIGIEGCYTAKNAKTFYSLSAVHGAIMACAGQNNVDVITLTPSLIKRKCTGKGNATKEEVADAIANIYRDALDWEEIAGSKYYYDITDAVAVYHTLLSTIKTKEGI